MRQKLLDDDGARYRDEQTECRKADQAVREIIVQYNVGKNMQIHDRQRVFLDVLQCVHRQTGGGELKDADQYEREGKRDDQVQNEMVVAQELHAQPIIDELHPVEYDRRTADDESRSEPNSRDIHPKTFQIITECKVDDGHQCHIDIPKHRYRLGGRGRCAADYMHRHDAFEMRKRIKDRKQDELFRAAKVFRQPQKEQIRKEQRRDEPKHAVRAANKASADDERPQILRIPGCIRISGAEFNAVPDQRDRYEEEQIRHDQLHESFVDRMLHHAFFKHRLKKQSAQYKERGHMKPINILG